MTNPYIMTAIASIFIFLTGCSGISSEAQKRIDKMHDAVIALDWDIKACNASYPKKIGNYYNRSRCLDKAIFTYSDMDNGYYKEAISIAKERDNIYLAIDNRQISPEQGQKFLNAALENIQAEAKVRQNEEFSLQRAYYSSHPMSCEYTEVYGKFYQHCF